MQIKAVLFDLFDTLVLIEGGETFYTPSLRRLHEFLVKNGINVSFEDFAQIYFEVRDNVYAEAAKRLEEPHFNLRVSKTLQRLGYAYDVSNAVVVGATLAFADEFMRYLHLDEDTIDVLRKLHEKYKLGLVSNFAIPECVQKLLKKFSLDGFFDAVVISGAINRRKPNPEIFERALRTLGVQASETLFVGDTLNVDVQGAKNVGMKAILIERKTAVRDSPDSPVWKPPTEETTIQPDEVIKSLKDLLPLLQDNRWQ
jgi:putative hydrolase of the HAD superfamily